MFGKPILLATYLLAGPGLAAPSVKTWHPIARLPEEEFKALELSTIVPKMVPIPAHALPYNATAVNSFIPHHAAKRLNGEDNRYQSSDLDSYPRRVIGKFVRSDNIICSAQLIGPRHVILAHHCINGESSNPPVTMTFFPGYDNGPSRLGSSQVTVATWVDSPGGNGCDTAYDFALLVLADRLGDNLGYFGQVSPDRSKFDQPIFTSVGYPGDRDNTQRPYRQDAISIPSSFVFPEFACDQQTKPIYSDADVAGGQSGSALYNGDAIWGITSISITYGNNQGGAGYASGDVMTSAINSVRQQYP